MSERELKTCQSCGREFFGWSTRKLCQSCADGKKHDDSKDRELSDERDGWRHMLRDATGTVIVPGGNVITALDDLCAYEETCEAAGIHGPEELRKALAGLAKGRGAASSGPSGHLPLKGKASEGGSGDCEPQQHRVKRPRWYSGYYCESCASYDPTVPSGGHGICKIHKRKVRPEGGKGHKYITLDEPRQVMARRVACGDWTDKDGSKPPQWVGPSAELMPEDT